MALAAVLLGFSAATQDIVIDAYRIEAAETSLQAMMSATYIAGYRVGMVVSGAGALYLAAALGSTAEHYVFAAWRWTYIAMAGTMLVGIATTLLIPEPVSGRLATRRYGAWDYFRLVIVFAGAATAFVATFFLSGNGFAALQGPMGQGPLAGFLLETPAFPAGDPDGGLDRLVVGAFGGGGPGHGPGDLGRARAGFLRPLWHPRRPCCSWP